MANGFKKFIDVSGKSPEEIKKSINSLLNGVVDTVVDTVVDDVTQFVPGDVRRKIKQSIREACQAPRSSKTPENTVEKEYKAEKIPPRQQIEIKAVPKTNSKPEGYRDQDGNYIPPLPPEPPEFDPDAAAYPREPVYEPQDEQEAFMIE